MDSIYQKQLKLSRADKQKQVEYLKEMYDPLRRREKGINGHDGKNKKCNKCGTKDVINSKTQSLMKDQKESISSLEKNLQAIKYERFSTNMKMHELKKENNKLKSKSEIQIAKLSTLSTRNVNKRIKENR
jgi:succinate dehydrogenase/fumarate reductase flavoprotein subunit